MFDCRKWAEFEDEAMSLQDGILLFWGMPKESLANPQDILQLQHEEEEGEEIKLGKGWPLDVVGGSWYHDLSNNLFRQHWSVFDLLLF